MKKTIAELSVDSNLLFDAISKAEAGQVFTYLELSAIVGRDVTKEARGNLYTAIRKARNECGIVFATTIKVGIKRLADTEIAAVGDQALHRIHSTAIRTSRKLTCVVDFDAMPNESKVKHNTALSMFGAISQATRPQAVRKISDKVSAAQSALPSAAVLELFK